jgi:hypothetical protein
VAGISVAALAKGRSLFVGSYPYSSRKEMNSHLKRALTSRSFVVRKFTAKPRASNPFWGDSPKPPSSQHDVGSTDTKNANGVEPAKPRASNPYYPPKPTSLEHAVDSTKNLDEAEPTPLMSASEAQRLLRERQYRRNNLGRDG